MPTGFRIVVIRDRGASDIASLLQQRGHEAATVRSIDEALTELARAGGELLLLELPNIPEGGRAALARIREGAHGVPFIVVGVDDDIKGPMEAYELGAHEHFSEQPDGHRLLESIGIALGARRRDSQLRYLRERDQSGTSWDELAGRSEAMSKLRATLDQLVRRFGNRVAPPMLLLGESGTGKGLIAKSVHYAGTRRHGPFVHVNCAAIPPSLMESELFGYERGAFTDAYAARQGLFETATEGTLFLDEIACLPYELQGKLLLATEERSIRRIGGRKPIPVDVQIVAATHRDLAAMVRETTFREDLYHRLNVISLHVPPLRERGADKVVLAERFAAAICAEYGLPTRQLTDDAIAAIHAYTWPGNVRELKNRIERAILLGDETAIDGVALDLPLARDVAVARENDKLRISIPSDPFDLDELERAVLLEVLRRHDFNVSRAAKHLRMGRQKLLYRMRKHGIERPETGLAYEP